MGKIPTIISPDTKRKDRVPPGQRAIPDFPVLHFGGIPKIDINKWTFTISGLVKKETKLNYKEFTSLQRINVFSDIHCVTTWSRLSNLWEGISTSVIKKLVQIHPNAKFVMVYGENGFSTNLSIEDFFAEDVLFALKHDNKEINPEHGYPVRLVVPRLYFWKSAKWVTGIEFMQKDKLGFWESNGYHSHGDPWKEERYSR